MANAGANRRLRKDGAARSDDTGCDNTRQVSPVAPVDSENLADWQLDRQFRRLRRWFAVCAAEELCRQGLRAECLRPPGRAVAWWADHLGIVHQLVAVRYLTRPLIIRITQDAFDPGPSAATIKRLGAASIACVRGESHFELNCLPSESTVSVRFIATFAAARVTGAKLPAPPIRFTEQFDASDNYLWSAAAAAAHDDWHQRQEAARAWRRKWRQQRAEARK